MTTTNKVDDKRGFEMDAIGERPTRVDDERTAVADVARSYGVAIDALEFAALAALFTDDAVVEYAGHPVLTGGAATAALLQPFCEECSWMQHLVTVMDVHVDGDDATCLSYFSVHMVQRADTETVRLSVGEYRDRMRRTSAGWKICERRMRSGWTEVRSRAPI